MECPIYVQGNLWFTCECLTGVNESSEVKSQMDARRQKRKENKLKREIILPRYLSQSTLITTFFP